MTNQFDCKDIKICSTLGADYMPQRKSPDDAGIDIRTPVDIVLPPGAEMVVDTGLIVDLTHIDQPLYTQIVPRSSAGFKYGLELKNTVGIIDRSYCGPTDTVKVAISRKDTRRVIKACPTYKMCLDWIDAQDAKGVDTHNWMIDGYGDMAVITDGSPVKTKLYKKGERFAQMIIQPYLPAEVEAVKLEQLRWQSRGGIGSTGDA